MSNMDRTRGIGGSDVGAILGVDRWKTAYDVWLDKMGEGEPFEDTPPIFWGRALEAPVANRFAAEIGAFDLAEPPYRSNPRYAWLGGHADRTLTLPDGTEAILEVKTSGAHMGSMWGRSGARFGSPTQAWTHVPESALCQLAYYQAVFERPTGFVAVLIGGQDFRFYEVRRDPTFELDLLTRLDEWWKTYVVGQTPPPVVSSADADKRWPHEDDDVAALKPQEPVLAALDRLREVKDAIATLTAERRELEGRVKAGLGEAPAMTDHDGRIAVSWRSRTSRRLDQKMLRSLHPAAADECTVESEYRVLRVAAKKRGV